MIEEQACERRRWEEGNEHCASVRASAVNVTLDRPEPVIQWSPTVYFELLIAPIFAASTLSLLLIPPHLYIMAIILHHSLSSYVVPRAGTRQVLVKGDRSSLRAGFLFGMSCLADHWDTQSSLDRCSACFAFSSPAHIRMTEERAHRHG